MLILDIHQLLEHFQSLPSQIKFCEQMAHRMASHDRPASDMYLAIAMNLKKLETPNHTDSPAHDRTQDNFPEKSQLDQTTAPANESSSGPGERNPLNEKERNQRGIHSEKIGAD